MVMAEILWDKKVGAYDRIGSDYLTPEPYAHDIKIRLEIEVYSIMYDWGNMDNEKIMEFSEPYYIGNLEGQVTSANFTIDSTSDMRNSGSFSIILDEDSKFIVHADDAIFWQHVWFKVIKKYDYINDIDMYPMYNWGDHIGLWNNNGLFASDPSQSVLGWFVPNSGSYSYNTETRELSLSCTDMLSFYTDTRGGHISDWWESLSSPKFLFYGTVDNNNAEFIEDKKDVAKYAGGVSIEGAKNLQMYNLVCNNYLASLSNGSEKVSSEIDKEKLSVVWEDAYKKYANDHKDEEIKWNFVSSGSNSNSETVSHLVTHLVANYGQLIPVPQVYVNLQNDYEGLPYDLEFNGDTTLYDMLKKIVDLYPRQYIYFDADRCLTLEQQALAWNDLCSDNDVRYRAREFSDLVLEEQWTINTENIKNFTVVWGRDECCCGYYYMTSFKAVCPKCGKLHEFPTMRVDGSDRNCIACGTRLQRLHGTNDTYSVQQIGTHKQVIYDDNVLTEEEAFNTAKWRTIEKCRAAKTLTVTLMDRYLSMYQRDDKGVGKRIEYKSKLTGDTDVYNVLKWSNDFNNATVTLELEPYYSCIDENLKFTGDGSGKYDCMILPLPEFTYTIDENGLLTMIIHNGWHTAYSLFKVYIAKTNLPVGAEEVFWNMSTSMTFIGETCEVYTEETETEHQTKIFRYQFKKSGRYLLTCQAWNPNIMPSGCTDMKVIEVNIDNANYISSDGKYFVDEDNNVYVS